MIKSQRFGQTANRLGKPSSAFGQLLLSGVFAAGCFTALAAVDQPLRISTAKAPSATAVTLNWTCATGLVCQVQATSNLLNWVDVGLPVTSAGLPLTWSEDVSLSQTKRFYRVKETAPSSTGASFPAQVLNLLNWKLTLPIDTSAPGSPDEIKQPQLATYSNTNYFYLNTTKDGVVFIAPCGGATTSGSGYPRSELREMTNSGTAQASWSMTAGTHTMEVTEAFTHLPVVKPHCVGAQIHNAADDVITVRLEGSHLFFDQNGANGPTMTTSYHLGDKFTAKWIAHNGGVECYYNGQYIYTYPTTTTGCYFKAGCYTQSNTSKGDLPTAYGEVVVYNLTVTHQ